jgi:GT2 family glycosyltransferase
MIYYFTPWADDGNLGAAYNRYMELLPNDDDWACMLDGDTMFLIPDWGEVIANAIAENPEAGMFTCYTNRVNNPQQLYNGHFNENGDLHVHRRIAIVCRETMNTRVKPLTRVISGMMMIIQKRTWREFYFKDGILGVDNDISRRLMQAGKQVLLIQGIYLAHYYRLNEGRRSTAHLLKQTEPCRDQN